MKISEVIKQFKIIASTLGRIPQPRDCSKMSGSDFRALTDINTAKAKAVGVAEYLTEYGVADAIPTDKVRDIVLEAISQTYDLVKSGRHVGDIGDDGTDAEEDNTSYEVYDKILTMFNLA